MDKGGTVPGGSTSSGLTGHALAEGRHRVQWLPELSIGTADVCAISANLQEGILYGGARDRV